MFFYLRILDDNFDETTRRIAGLFPQLMEVMEGVMAQQTLNLEAQIRESAAGLFPPTSDHPIGYDRTGNLIESIHATEPYLSGARVEGYVDSGGDDAPYAKYFLPPSLGGTGGTSPHMIPLDPKTPASTPQFLHFMQGGVEKFRRQVSHPGFPERDFITQIFEQWIETFPSHVQEAIDRILV